jgi:ribosomal protein S18 acetylase RimI-like enzyme
MSQPDITFRPITEGDMDFLARLYASTRWEELQQVPWSDEQRLAFLRQQFDAQHTYYMEHFVDAAFDLIVIDGKPAGRLYLDRREEEIRLIDIALLPKHRGQGIGGRLMADILKEGQDSGLRVRIHVEQNNPAMRLYQRLGFQKIEEQGVYHLMEWTPG